MNWLKRVINRIIRSNPKWWVIVGLFLLLLEIAILIIMDRTVEEGAPLGSVGYFGWFFFFYLLPPLTFSALIFLLVGATKKLRYLRITKGKEKWKRGGLLILLTILVVPALWILRFLQERANIFPFASLIIFYFISFISLIIIGVSVWMIVVEWRDWIRSEKWCNAGLLILAVVFLPSGLWRFRLISSQTKSIMYFLLVPLIIIGIVAGTLAISKERSWGRVTLISISAMVIALIMIILCIFYFL
jgi:hypothetical protein